MKRDDKDKCYQGNTEPVALNVKRVLQFCDLFSWRGG